MRSVTEHLELVLSDAVASAPLEVSLLGTVGCVLAQDVEVDDDGEPIDDDLRGKVRLFLTRSQASAFCQQADHVVSAGRAPCHWCGQPINPDGHACPRMN